MNGDLKSGDIVIYQGEELEVWNITVDSGVYLSNMKFVDSDELDKKGVDKMNNIPISKVNQVKVWCPYCRLTQQVYGVSSTGSLHFCDMSEGGCDTPFVVELESGVSKEKNGTGGFEHVIYPIVSKIQGKGERVIPWDAKRCEFEVKGFYDINGGPEVIFQATKDRGIEQIGISCGIDVEIHNHYDSYAPLWLAKFDDKDEAHLFIKFLQEWVDFDYYNSLGAS